MESGQKPICAEACIVQQLRLEILEAQAQEVEFRAKLVKQFGDLDPSIVDKEGVLEALSDISAAGATSVESANSMAEIALAACPLAQGKRIGLKRRLFPIGCASPIVRKDSIDAMEVYPSLVKHIMNTFWTGHGSPPGAKE